MSRGTAVKVGLSLAVGGVCVALCVKGMNPRDVLRALRALSPGAIALYLAMIAVTHLFRSWRWEYLLRPAGVSLPWRRLMLISSVGWMAILALPFRLGEFVRPYFVKRERGGSMSAILGTVAVERIVDGLLISILFFGTYLASGRGGYPPALRVAAWLSLLLFVAATTFLALARVWTERTIAFALRVSLLDRLAPRRAEQLAHKLRALISGFNVLADHRNFGIFLAQSVIYWAANGLGMWVLAHQMGLPISLGAAFATMAITGLVLTAPNSPGLVGQFELAVMWGLGAYLPAGVVKSTGFAYGLVVHGVQSFWYVAIGLAALPALSARGARTSLADAVRASNLAVEAADGPGPEAEGAMLKSVT
ncbi:MAG TPA: lysylphosphatidylglycerol synthase transmembrane domain-containing protein [Polyangia bacterium]|nr:lysylphosphatidylglycerol synthase transmembrane domain-containing protein [Polyangia bacterium]